MFKNMSSSQRSLLFVLTIINLLNYLDRQVIFPLFGHIKAEFGLSDVHLGIIGTVFLVVQSLALVPMGMLADRIRRPLIVSASITFWSIATALSGMAQNFWQLLGTRAMVGIGEAGYAPSSAAMITDNFSDNHNSRVQGIFNVGMIIGGTLGAMIGGLIAYYLDNWRLALFVVSIPGFLVAYYAYHMYDKRAEHDEPVISLWTLTKNVEYMWIIVSGVFVSFATGAFITWGIEFITRYRGYNIKDASLLLGVGMMIASVVGVLLGSYIADHLHKKYRWARSAVVAFSLLVSAPLMFFGLSDVGQYSFLIYFFTGAMLLAVYLGPVISVLHDIVPTQFRASAYAVYALIIHLVGESTAPVVIGLISDQYSLRTGLQFATLFVFLAGLCFIPVVYRRKH
jgi:MFS transporter, Spinster family, sphingosine-1-phosphate transporter